MKTNSCFDPWSVRENADSAAAAKQAEKRRSYDAVLLPIQWTSENLLHSFVYSDFLNVHQVCIVSTEKLPVPPWVSIYKGLSEGY